MDFKFTIPLPPRTKKNSQQIVKVKERMILIQNKNYLKFEKDCKWYMPKIDTIDKPINLKCIYYMPTKRRVDLVNLQNATLDILVKYKVITDDNRDIVASMDGSRVYYSKSEPRTEIEITEIKDYEKWGKE